ncbi:MAG: CPBP family intramembrane metalloprotease [Spirochaetaceae bacterium]|nr:CPBP family intramembrane metalloprotease [Spirochaetaceae bacterium]
MLSSLAPGLPSPPGLEKPQDAFSWSVLVLFYLASAYLEETYFRIYLEAALQKAKWASPARLLLSTGLFTLCHLYQGPLGLCNALIAGIFLLLFYRKTQSPHGLALGHGLYNVLAYVLQ